jgi:membrane-associated phospholipid phosphatase
MSERTKGADDKVWSSLDLSLVVVWGLVVVASFLCWGSPGFNELLLRTTGLFGLTVISPPICARFGRIGREAGRMLLAGLTLLNGYEVARIFVNALRNTSYEMAMIRLDHFLFGGNPSEWFQAVQLPLLTEYFQLTYMLYFPLMLLTALALLGAKKYAMLHRYLGCMVAAAVCTFVGYVAVPVRCPYIIAEMGPYQSLLNYRIPLEGVYWTDMFREALLDVTTMRHDCFPSGHTMHTVIAMFFAWRANRLVGAFVSVIGISIVISTLYLRYHYAVDVLAGLAIAGILIAIFAGDKVFGEETTERSARGR